MGLGIVVPGGLYARVQQLGGLIGGDMTLISDTTLGANGTFDFQNIPQTYADLVLIVMARGTDAASIDNLRIRFNNDAGANWSNEQLQGTNSSTNNNSESNATSGWLTKNLASAGLGTANAWSMQYAWIPFYAHTNSIKQVFAQAPVGFSASASGTIVSILSSTWLGPGAISRIQLFGLLTANLQSGSRARLYGMT